MLPRQHLNRGQSARNEHSGASLTISMNDPKHSGPAREASPRCTMHITRRSKPPPAAAPCPCGIFVAIASCERHPRPICHSPTLDQHAGSITKAAAQLESISAAEPEEASVLLPKRPTLVRRFSFFSEIISELKLNPYTGRISQELKT